MRFANEHAYDDLIFQAAADYAIPAYLLQAVIGVESGFDPAAYNGADVSVGGSYGLAQMSADTARVLGYDGDPSGLLDPSTNIDLAARYLADLWRASYGGGADGDRIPRVLSMYNGGQSAIRHWDGKRVSDYGSPFINESYVNRAMQLVAYFEAQDAQGSGVSVPDATGDPSGSGDPSRVLLVLAGLLALAFSGGLRRLFA